MIEKSKVNFDGVVFKAYDIKLDIYKDYVLVVLFSENKNKIKKACEIIKNFKSAYNNSASFCFMDTFESPVMFIKEKVTHGTIAHECYHVVNRMSKKIGLSDDGDNEQQAYLLAYLVQNVNQILKGKNIIKKI